MRIEELEQMKADLDQIGNKMDVYQRKIALLEKENVELRDKLQNALSELNIASRQARV